MMTDSHKKGPSPTSIPKSNDSNNPSNKSRGKIKEEDVLDSWENGLLSSDEDEDGGGTLSTAEKQPPASYTTSTSSSRTDASDTNTSLRGTRAPPSPPLAHPLASDGGWSTPDRPPGRGDLNTSPGDQRRRPEKQTAVANRIIAGALGVRAQRTEEQKSYDRAVRENERKRIAREREEAAKRKQDEEHAKAAVWED